MVNGEIMEYEQYEVECNKIRKTNKLLLKEFSEHLSQAGLKHQTVSSHVNNIDFYVNEFLLYEDAIHAQDGVDEVRMFLGYWFIKKAMWANESAIRANATSLKKFYGLLAAKNLVDPAEVLALEETIKEELPDWLESMRRYDDPNIELVW